MSLAFEVILRAAYVAFSPKPKISKDGQLLLIQSGWKTALWTLGARKRVVKVNPRARILTLSDRRWWFYRRSQAVRFEDVEEIYLDYVSIGGSGWSASRGSDLYTVSLQLRTGKGLKLFRFLGPGEFMNNSIWPDWMYWDEFLEEKLIPGNHDGAAQQVADILAKLIGVQVGSTPD